MKTRDGKWLEAAGLVLVRQRPGSAKGVMFITIEDETSHANLVVWVKALEKCRRVVLGAGMIGVYGKVQRQGEVARSEWRAHPRGSALTRSDGCAHSMLGRRPTGRRKRASPMPTPSIRIPAFGAMAQRYRPMDNSSVRAIELQSAATSTCITAASPDRSFIAICQISTATSAFCPSVRPRASRRMCSMGSSIRTRSSTSRSTLPIPAVPVIISSGCSP